MSYRNQTKSITTNKIANIQIIKTTSKPKTPKITNQITQTNTASEITNYHKTSNYIKTTNQSRSGAINQTQTQNTNSKTICSNRPNQNNPNHPL